MTRVIGIPVTPSNLWIGRSAVLWAVFTVLAAAAQTMRNATQRSLTGQVGALGATYVRFIFGLPFGIALLGLARLATGEALPVPSGTFLLWTAAGGATQIAATALMLQAMTSASFVVTTAYTKTEPVQVAIFGLIFLGDRLTPLLATAIALATLGVFLLSMPASRKAKPSRPAWETGPAMLGIAAGGLFAMSAVCFRGGIHELPSGNAWLRASTTLAVGLGLQTITVVGYMLVRDRALLGAIFRSWRPSLAAGLLGAAASQFWFLGFALTTAARVRTLGLVEVLFAHLVSGRMYRERPTSRELAGLGLVIVGVALSLNA